MYIFKLEFSSFPDVYTGVGLLNHIVALVLVFYRTSILFSIMGELIYVPTDIVGGFSFSLHPLQHLCILVSYLNSNEQKSTNLPRCIFNDLALLERKPWACCCCLPTPYLCCGRVPTGSNQCMMKAVTHRGDDSGASWPFSYQLLEASTSSSVKRECCLCCWIKGSPAVCWESGVGIRPRIWIRVGTSITSPRLSVLI